METWKRGDKNAQDAAPQVACRAAAHAGLCAFQCARWHSREQYRTASHRAHTLLASSDAHLAATLFHLRKHAEAEQLLAATLKTQKRVLGPAHPHTLNTASLLNQMQSQMRAAQPAAADGKAPDTASPLPAGTRVLVQRLVAKPEHNGKRARVLSFDARKGRYAVALDDAKELSLKPECVARAGCAAAGCASEEASSVCGRCEAVRYCSRECQRADWKAHKAACASPSASSTGGR